MDDLITWFEAHPEVLRWMALASVVTFVASLVLLPLVVARLPSDYFALTRRRVHCERGPGLFTLALLAARNLLGLVLLLSGIAMLVLPGQGILTILVGLSLLSFPGKRRLQAAIVRRESVRTALGWLRRRAGRPPFDYGDVD